MRRTKKEAVEYLKGLCEKPSLRFLLEHNRTFVPLMINTINIGKKYIKEDPHETYKNIDLTKVNLDINLDLIKGFDDKLGLPNNVDEMVKNGTIELNFVDDNPGLDGHENVVKLRNGNAVNVEAEYAENVINSSILVHEISHAKNWLYKKEAFYTRWTFTEILSYFEEFMYIDYLRGQGYKDDANYLYMNEILILFGNMINVSKEIYMLLTYYYFGDIEKESYSMLFNPKYYEQDLNYLLNSNKLKSYRYVYAMCKPFAVYLHSKYKNNPEAGKEINKLQDDITKLPVNEFLKQIGIFDVDDLKKVLSSIENETENCMKVLKSYKEKQNTKTKSRI